MSKLKLVLLIIATLFVAACGGERYGTENESQVGNTYTVEMTGITVSKKGGYDELSIDNLPVGGDELFVKSTED